MAREEQAFNLWFRSWEFTVLFLLQGPKLARHNSNRNICLVGALFTTGHYGMPSIRKKRIEHLLCARYWARVMETHKRPRRCPQSTRGLVRTQAWKQKCGPLLGVARWGASWSHSSMVSLRQGRVRPKAKSDPYFSQGKSQRREGLHRGGGGFQLPGQKEPFK